VGLASSALLHTQALRDTLSLAILVVRRCRCSGNSLPYLRPMPIRLCSHTFRGLVSRLRGPCGTETGTEHLRVYWNCSSKSIHIVIPHPCRRDRHMTFLRQLRRKPTPRKKSTLRKKHQSKPASALTLVCAQRTSKMTIVAVRPVHSASATDELFYRCLNCATETSRQFKRPF
jgi:hypothetical protein